MITKFDQFLNEKLGVNQEVEEFATVVYNACCDALKCCQITEQDLIIKDEELKKDTENKYNISIRNVFNKSSKQNYLVLTFEDYPKWAAGLKADPTKNNEILPIGNYYIGLYQEKFSIGGNSVQIIEFDFRINKNFKKIIIHELNHVFQKFKDENYTWSSFFKKFEETDNAFYYFGQKTEMDSYLTTIYQNLKDADISNKQDFIDFLNVDKHYIVYKMIANDNQETAIDKLKKLFPNRSEIIFKIPDKDYKTIQQRAQTFIKKIHKLYDLL